MPSKVTTSVVVQFATGDADGTLVAEVDGRDPDDGGLNGGKTSFVPGDDVIILTYKSDNVAISFTDSSLGQLVVSGSAFAVEVEEQVTFAGEEEASVRYPINGALKSVEWFGNNLGNVTPLGQNKVQIPAPSSGHSVGVAKLTYDSIAVPYRLSQTSYDADDYSIVCFFLGTVA